MKYQGRTIVEVSPERLRTNIQLFGRQGYAWGTGSQKINFLMVAKSAVIHIVKFDKVRVIGGDMNLAGQGFDGYTVFARIYHDVFVPDNKRVALYCSVVSTAVAAPAMVLDVMIENGKIKAITTAPGDKLAFVVTSSAAPSNGVIGSTATLTHAKVGDAVASTTTWYAIDSNRNVLASYTHTIASV